MTLQDVQRWLTLLSILGGIAAGVWQGGRIQATLQDGIDKETSIRVAENKATDQRLASFAETLKGVAADVRELRSYVWDSGPRPPRK